LEVGKKADLVIVDRDILSIDPQEVMQTQVQATYVDGHRVYHR
jgi:predicted amidohydrolase YtcJ